MITESYEWRDVLARDLRDLRRRLQKTATSRRSDVWGRTGAKIEMFTFTAGFIARKLMESNKLSDDIEHKRIPALKYDPIDRAASFDYLYTRNVFYEYYNMERAVECTLSGRDLCNMLVHSLVFWVGSDTEEGTTFNTIIFNSDRTKDALFQVSLETFFKFIEEVILDEIEKWSIDRITGKAKKPKRQGPNIFSPPRALSQ